jgi:hypothetical protein
VPSATAGSDDGLVGDAVGADNHDGRFAGGGDDDGFSRDDDGLGRSTAGDGDVDSSSGAENALGIFDADPDFNSGAARVECGADEGDFAGDGIGEAGDDDGCSVTFFE